MLSRSKTPVLALLVGAMTVAMATPALAAEFSNSEFVIIQEDEVLEDDLYAAAVKVTVSGVIDGDLIALAGEAVIIEGRVTGSVIAAAPRVEISGVVDGSLRVTGNDVVVTGEVGVDVVAAAVDVDLSDESLVGGDVHVWGWSVTSLGQIEGNLEGTQQNLSVAGEVGGDIDVTVNRVSVVGDLTVGGDFGYRSDNEVDGLEQANVGGAVVHKTPLPPNVRVRALGVFGSFLIILFLTITALAVAWGWPDRTSRAVTRVGEAPWSAWWRGAIVLASPLILMAMVGLVLGLAPASSSFPLLVILVPIVLALAGLVMALCLVAGIPAAGRLGSLLFRRLDLYGAILLGSAVAGLVWLLPVVGWLVPAVALPLGLGAWMLSWREGDPGEAHA